MLHLFVIFTHAALLPDVRLLLWNLSIRRYLCVRHVAWVAENLQ